MRWTDDRSYDVTEPEGPMTRDEAVAAVRRAISDEGRNPAHHRAVMLRHQQEWPTLWAAIDDLLRADLADRR